MMITPAHAEKLRKHDRIIENYEFYSKSLKRIGHIIQRAINAHEAKAYVSFSNLTSTQQAIIRDLMSDYVDAGYKCNFGFNINKDNKGKSTFNLTIFL